MTSFVKSYLRQGLLCLVVCFHFDLAQFTQLLSNFGRFTDQEERSDNTLTCVSSTVATWSSSPNFITVVCQSQGYFVTFACLSRSLFHVGLAHFFNFSQALVVATKRKAARKCVDLSRAVAIWSSGAHAPTPNEK